jgi:undecaprenyl diphosphate synthase
MLKSREKKRVLNGANASNSISVPGHVAIIMDGNGRWAHQRGLPRALGHSKGVGRVKEVVELAGEWGIKTLTLFAFSEENWSRPPTEVSALMKLMEKFIATEEQRLKENNVRLHVLGNLGRLPASTRDMIQRAVENLAENNGMQLNIALSYSGRSEIVSACQKIATKIAEAEIKPDQIDESYFAQHLDTAGGLDPDLIIRTSGELRLSNFLLWQLAYAELYFTECYWPDFGESEFRAALSDYQKRVRRFGCVSEETVASDRGLGAVVYSELSDLPC